MSNHEEAQVSAHIRRLLLDYVYRHITTNYQSYTEQVVSELLPSKMIPEHDPSSLTLPTDPFTSLVSIYQLGKLPAYNEKFTTSQEACLLLKSSISVPKSLARSKHRLWPSDDLEDLSLFRVETILTRRALYGTPTLDKAQCRRAEKLKEAYKSFIPSNFRLKTITVISLPEPDVKINQVLDVTYSIKASDHTAVRNLLQSAITMSRSRSSSPKKNSKDYRWTFLPPAFSLEPSRSPFPDSPPLVPIFPRNIASRQKATLHGRSECPPIPRSYSEVPRCTGPIPSGKFMQSDDDGAGSASRNKSLANENMVIVDGWQTYATSSPSTICSDDEHVDQLGGILPTSPDTSVADILNLVQDTEESKLLDIQIPRTKRVGGNVPEPESIVDRAQKTGGLRSFLAPLLDVTIASQTDSQQMDLHPLLQSRKPGFQNVPDKRATGCNTGAESVPSPQREIRTNINSICGQVSATVSETSQQQSGDNEIYGLQQDLAILGKVTFGRLSKATVDSKSLIREEPLFDEVSEAGRGKEREVADKNARRQEIQLTMKSVPILPEPNSYVRARPCTLSDYLIESNTTSQPKISSPYDEQGSPMRFLKSVKGIAPLRIALSWVPFIRATSTPPRIESDLLEGVDDLESVARDTQALLACVCSAAGDLVEGCEYEDKGRRHIDGSTMAAEKSGDGSDFSSDVFKCEIILTRRERGALLARESGQRVDEDYVPDNVHGTQNILSEVQKLTNDEHRTRSPFDSKEWKLGEHQGSVSEKGNHYKGAHDIELSIDQERSPRPRKRMRISHENLSMEKKLSSLTYGNLDIHGTPQLMELDLSGDDQDTLPTEPPLGDEDKENWPLYSYQDAKKMRSSFSSKQTQLPLQDPCLSMDYRGRLNSEDDRRDPGGSFEALSLSYESQNYQAYSAQQSQASGIYFRKRTGAHEHEQNQSHPTTDAAAATDMDPDNPSVTNIVYEHNTLGSAPPSTILTSVMTIDSDLIKHPLGTDAFAVLRAKPIKSAIKSTLLPGEDTAKTVSRLEQEHRSQMTATTSTPLELYDSRTISPLSPQRKPTAPHKYMASLQLLQKQALFKRLSSQECRVQLVERDSLDGVDLVIDPCTAVIFTSLLSLPADNRKLLETLSIQTWHYQRLLVVFEAYPASISSKGAAHPRKDETFASPEPELRAYTPPVLKAIKRFRRDLGIAEGYGKLSTFCKVWYAFANSVGEAAAFARLFGDEAELADATNGALWGAREWLDMDASEDEEALASFRGMNRFSASVVLCQMTFEQFIDMDQEDRKIVLEPLVGVTAIDVFNRDLQQRINMLEV